MSQIPYALVSDEGDEEIILLPAHWEICSACAGEGKSSAHLGAFTGEEMAEDPDFAEDYMRGVYDRPCSACEGSGKVQRMDRDQIDAALLRRIDRREREFAEVDAIWRAEMRAEGWLQ